MGSGAITTGLALYSGGEGALERAIARIDRGEGIPIRSV
jgi:hypothetical protein